MRRLRQGLGVTQDHRDGGSQAWSVRSTGSCAVGPRTTKASCRDILCSGTAQGRFPPSGSQTPAGVLAAHAEEKSRGRPEEAVRLGAAQTVVMVTGRDKEPAALGQGAAEGGRAQSRAETPVEAWWPNRSLRLPLGQSLSLWPQFPFLDNRGGDLAAPPAFTGFGCFVSSISCLSKNK